MVSENCELAFHSLLCPAWMRASCRSPSSMSKRIQVSSSACTRSTKGAGAWAGSSDTAGAGASEGAASVWGLSAGVGAVSGLDPRLASEGLEGSGEAGAEKAGEGGAGEGDTAAAEMTGRAAGCEAARVSALRSGVMFGVEGPLLRTQKKIPIRATSPTLKIAPCCHDTRGIGKERSGAERSGSCMGGLDMGFCWR